jgi:hypothetical protein
MHLRYCLKCGRKNTTEGEACQFCSHPFVRPSPVVPKEPMQITEEEMISEPSTEEIHEMENAITRLTQTATVSESQAVESAERAIRGYKLEELIRKDSPSIP